MIWRWQSFAILLALVIRLNCFQRFSYELSYAMMSNNPLTAAENPRCVYVYLPVKTVSPPNFHVNGIYA